MTEEQYKLVGTFEARVRQILFLCDDLKTKNEDLKTQLEQLNESFKTIEEENKILKNKYDSLKMARLLSVKQDDFKSAKTRLSKLVREVDKCIALLNE
jgi:SMC interacting uncharacterized protein involved in chromosome segregation